MVKIIDGFPEWSDNRECLSLEYWFISDGVLKLFEALCPHGLAEIENGGIVTNEHIDGAIAWLEQEAIPNAESIDRQNGGKVLWYDPNYRGYLMNYPAEDVDAWVNDWSELAFLVTKSAKFEDFIRQDFSMPGFLKGTFYAEKIKHLALDFVRLSEVQEYLLLKARGMAEFWVGQFKRTGISGDFCADIWHAVVKERVQAPTEQDIEKFKEALSSSCFELLNKKRVPVYGTDYEVEGELKKVLEKHALMYLADLFPWKTKKFFDWSDAPKLTDQAIREQLQFARE